MAREIITVKTNARWTLRRGGSCWEPMRAKLRFRERWRNFTERGGFEVGGGGGSVLFCMGEGVQLATVTVDIVHAAPHSMGKPPGGMQLYTLETRSPVVTLGDEHIAAVATNSTCR